MLLDAEGLHHEGRDDAVQDDGEAHRRSQDFAIGSRYNIQLRADLYNLTDNQTGYNIQNQRNGTGAPFLEPRDFYDPRRLQLAVKFQF
jgi:hypothetical protein